jgi:hypothetical protein
MGHGNLNASLPGLTSSRLTHLAEANRNSRNDFPKTGTAARFAGKENDRNKI